MLEAKGIFDSTDRKHRESMNLVQGERTLRPGSFQSDPTVDAAGRNIGNVNTVSARGRNATGDVRGILSLPMASLILGMYREPSLSAILRCFPVTPV